jgi:ribosomal protein L35
MSNTVDQLYESMVKDAGLYGKAFQRHKVSKKEARQLRAIRKAAEMTVGAREEFLASLKEKG